ncbi:hypothetical protein RchiOBHm_Chr2g0104081 [Rosa chinensis]|uniref:Uncharacterized protein n=1 Tax=Rosa chinensis TaxID=74649 RepID=A0A2P6RN22_ROSCH|nr:hypothetical protein RchiOBHm_Chr2g0104081 [Rosa chinensis]
MRVGFLARQYLKLLLDRFIQFVKLFGVPRIFERVRFPGEVFAKLHVILEFLLEVFYFLD